ncbi:transposase [Okeania sp. SIO3B5]|uniref:transposase n=1 Tax=Okeania sp. SIO3B5 TaxID=2607811 RepID=UPI0025F29E27|nr:transposase [Okeania sp. SIO3B5]
MRLVDRHIINRTHQYWRVCDELAFKSKNLYNLANYYCRQHFFKCGKSLDLTKLYHATKNSDAYRALPTKVSKQIIKCLVATWRGYFQAIKEWSRTSREVFR